VSEPNDSDSQATQDRRGPPVAEWSPGLGSTYRVYADGTLQRATEGTGGEAVIDDSIVGATARVERFGGRMFLRDTRRVFLTIRGPRVNVSVEIDRYVGVGAAQGFAAQVNQIAQELASRAPAPASGSITDQIRRLAELRDSGVLTAEEFERAKKRVLAEA
jgi:hypothetical protein